MQALALASGSALLGAAIMAVFVVGTFPLFAVMGYLIHKVATVWRGRLAIVTGIVVVALGSYTVLGSLEVLGSPITRDSLAQAVGIREAPTPSTDTVRMQNNRQIVTITARSTSYTPKSAQLDSGVTTTLIVRSKNVGGCAKSFVVPSMNIERLLPTNGDTRIELGALHSGTVRYSCGMGMYTGVLTVR
jgi:hypothetical protein